MENFEDRYSNKDHIEMIQLENSLSALGFKQTKRSHPLLKHFNYKIADYSLEISVQIFMESGRWEPFSVIRERGETTLSRPLRNIKNLQDLGNFISYL